ncbi:ABC transporter substrate-binding protein (plasmid) [Paracoccus versutus]|uniref:Iron complex transport system substrate-binding protein n=1 Tax=Paracoccus versutus TaxID=34007 RepID=A0AAQ0HDT4_PARVE|nr:ABC transporter substrate-binding protein [Paracoccus versutus]KGJ07320.1 cobalamin ABC transporter substrate-binding protein [Paracoccus versutus]REG33500.1 iron complex transport system substrate-binding protein [Paracoccus versutus]WEJ82141.1 ABC transporter substrate-binding protein [Paracoccus versutus]
MVRRLGLVAGLLAGLILPGFFQPAAAEPPRRVLSMNLCTDQLAMMLAAPGQLVSVSYLAQDPSASAMAAEAGRLPVNHGLAEEIFLMRPDLVLAGAWSTPETIRLLDRLNIPVEVFPIEIDIAGIRANIRRMGAVLGREAQARAMLARFDADLARLSDAQGPRPRAALYAANGYSSGSDSLAGEIVALAGFDNVADELGLPSGGVLPLETLLLSDPDLLVEGRRYAGHARAQEVLDHPALKALARGRPAEVMSDPDWVCGNPHILRAVSQLRDARLALQARP